ncbi:hypothetical protein N473_03380 [Pseudoalteromonas luteoviolacea CPMOR-1]|uniref:Uncharacterized protein n=1 Tax=Pseudoalteromonas luteoviolacea CPMOR-1 TaxID=1365248 RepID=A0A161XZ66_9GAMM|nr:hypothetical protein [Pseudoalteromonas luteoviolacea]KZN59211.1 hypothetical protein N473_03380 [Pseudoalteromonas luteoviolacea CPMOR-1]
MFSAVTKVPLHKQQIKKLWRQLCELEKSGIVRQHRFDDLHYFLVNHVYTLAQAQPSEFEWLDEQALNVMIKADWQALLPWHEQNAQQAPWLDTFLAMWLAEAKVPSTDLPIWRQSGASALFAMSAQAWLSDFSDAERQTMLTSIEMPEPWLVRLAFAGQPLNALQLQQALQSTHFEFVHAALVNMWLFAHDEFSAQLLKTFSATDEAEHKAQLLCLAGIAQLPDWQDACVAFCEHYPLHSAHVLSHFTHKKTLKLLVNWLDKQPMSQPAYQAWQILTEKELKLVAAISLAKGEGQLETSLQIPCVKQAETHRQALLQGQGEFLLQGKSFVTYERQLTQQFNGALVQKLVAAKYEQKIAAMLYFLPCTPRHWQFIDRRTTDVSE